MSFMTSLEELVLLAIRKAAELVISLIKSVSPWLLGYHADSFRYMVTVYTYFIVHEQHDLPAGAAVYSIDFLTARIIYEFIVTGVKRLASINWVQSHLVSDYNLNTDRHTLTYHVKRYINDRVNCRHVWYYCI